MRETNEFTHKVTMTICSNGPADEVAVSIEFEPDIEGKHISELGYLPAAYQFLEAYIKPALEEAYLQAEGMGSVIDPPSFSRH